MGLKDCLVSAADQGEISREEAQALADAFDERFAQARLSMGDDVAKARARRDLEADLRAQAAEKRRRADLTEAARLRVKGVLQDYRTRGGNADVYAAAKGLLSHYGYRGTSSVRGRTEAIIAGAHGKLSGLMTAFQRQGLLGKRANPALLADVVKELHGEASGDATARQLARGLDAVFEDLRRRFNAAGGAIGRIEHWFPHDHDRLKVKRAGRDQWKAAIRPLVDPARMTHPLTGQPVGAGGLDRALDHVWESIASDNRAHLRPMMARRGQGAVASQRQEERFLVFNDAASWLEYNRQFGRGDPVQAVFQHVNGMASDIAAMEVLGPNPAAMVEYLKQVVALEIGRREAGKPSLVPPSTIFPDSQAKVADYYLDSLWQTLRGRPTVASGAAAATGSIKNLLVSAQLGATSILAGATDPFIARAARQLAGLPHDKLGIAGQVKAMRTAGRDEIVASGVIWDEYLHVMHDELRFAGPAVGSEWSRWLADRGVTWSGLKPLTTGRKLVEARFWQHHVATMKDRTFGRLDKRFRTALEGFGVTSADWDIWRGSIDPQGFATPRQIELNGGDVHYLDMTTATPAAIAAETRALAHRHAAEKLSEVIQSWQERTVPSGTPNARAVATGAVPRGTVMGELADYFLQYKSFGLSFTALQLEALGEMAAARGGGQGWRTGLAYFAGLAVPLALGGALYIQLRNLADGKEAEDMYSPSFWLSAVITGGGFGLFGDFLKASENRFGQTPLETLAGPGLAFIGDMAKFTVGNARSLTTGEKTNIGRDATRLLGRYTPVASSHWALRGAYNRIFLDNLQWLTDPAADKSFKAKISAAKKRGAPYRIEPGAFTP